jgi:hypothetical protein
MQAEHDKTPDFEPDEVHAHESCQSTGACSLPTLECYFGMPKRMSDMPQYGEEFMMALAEHIILEELLKSDEECGRPYAAWSIGGLYHQRLAPKLLGTKVTDTMVLYNGRLVPDIPCTTEEFQQMVDLLLGAGEIADASEGNASELHLCLTAKGRAVALAARVQEQIA